MPESIDIAKGLCPANIDGFWHFNGRIDALPMVETRTMRCDISRNDSAMRPVLNVFARRNAIKLARNGRTIFRKKIAVHHRNLIKREDFNDDPDRIYIVQVFVVMKHKRFVLAQAEGLGKTI